MHNLENQKLQRQIEIKPKQLKKQMKRAKIKCSATIVYSKSPCFTRDQMRDRDRIWRLTRPIWRLILSKIPALCKVSVWCIRQVSRAQKTHKKWSEAWVWLEWMENQSQMGQIVRLAPQACCKMARFCSLRNPYQWMVSKRRKIWLEWQEHPR